MTDYKYYQDGEEIEDVHESRILIGPNSYNDNWELSNYTAEMRDSKDRFYAFIDFHSNEGSIRECPECLERGIHNKLQPRILEKNEPVPPDYDQYIQCYSCGNVYPIYEAHYESKIKDSLETTDNPFESNESHFEATKKRKYKDRLNNKYQDEDPDIAAEQKRYGSDNVRIIQ